MKKTKIILLLFTLVVLTVAVALFVGCDDGSSTYTYDYIVTFDYNVDNLGVPTSCETQYLGVDDGKTIIAPGSNDKFGTYDISDYYNEGWYLAAEIGEDGKPARDEKGNVILGKKWDFAHDVVKGEMTLYANYVKSPTFTIVVDGGDDITVSGKIGDKYARPTASLAPQKDGWTLIDYYTDDTYTTKYEFPHTFTEGDAKCYALMLEGTWRRVTNVSQFKTALSRGESMFIEAPDNVLDLQDEPFIEGTYNLALYNGKVYGHGCTIKNISIAQSYKTYTTSYSLFGNLGADAEFVDVTFENISFTVSNLNEIPTARVPEIKISLFASDIAAGAKFDNLNFVNCELNYNNSIHDDLVIYGYYATASAEYDCFDSANLTVKRDNVEVNPS